jgi:hypothetical protein
VTNGLGPASAKNAGAVKPDRIVIKVPSTMIPLALEQLLNKGINNVRIISE